MVQSSSENTEDPFLPHLPNSKRHRLRRGLLWATFSAAVLVAALVVASFFITEPLRQYTEATLNAQLHGYTARLPALVFQPIGCSVTLKGLTISQDAHPKPPVAEFPWLHASVHWRALLHARLVADFVFRRPRVHINRVQFQHEAADKVPLKEKGWQAALESIYPLKINRFEVRDGDVTYIDDDPRRPLHLSQLNLVAENIRNIRSPEHRYPSDLHVDGTIFDAGQLRVDGHANFLAEPYAGIDTDLRLDKVALDYFKPILARMNVSITSGALSADGHVEYAPRTQRIHMKQLTVRGVQVDYLHSAQTAAAEEARAAKVEHTARKLSNAPDVVMRVDHLQIAQSTVGYVDHSTDQAFRVFLAHTDLEVENLRNQATDVPAFIQLTGQFMGSGQSMVQATFQPVAKKPDLTAAIMIEGTDMRAMNDLLLRFADFDVVAGQFSFYSELSIKNDQIRGYLKPIFKDMQVYSQPQDATKPLPHQLYEALVQVLQAVLRNPQGEVGTTVEITGTVSDPETSTWQVVVGLVRNAFIKAVGHEFEHRTGGTAP